MRIELLVSALIVGGVLFACANGTDASATGDDGTGAGGDTDSGVTTDPTGNGTGVDSGNGGFVGPKDSGTTHSKDSGGGGGTDSGTGGGGTDSGTGGGGTNDDCTGTQGMQLNKSYSSECTNLSLNYGPCTSGNGDCIKAAMTNMTPGPLCCFTPKATSNCDVFFGVSCVPK